MDKFRIYDKVKFFPEIGNREIYGKTAYIMAMDEDEGCVSIQMVVEGYMPSGDIIRVSKHEIKKATGMQCLRLRKIAEERYLTTDRLSTNISVIANMMMISKQRVWEIIKKLHKDFINIPHPRDHRWTKTKLHEIFTNDEIIRMQKYPAPKMIPKD